MDYEISAEFKFGAAGGIVPILRKVREEWGTHFLGRGCEIKTWATRPIVQLLRYFYGCEYHVDHSAQPVLTRVWDGRKAERLFRPGNRAQHLSRPGHWSLGCNEYQLDH